MSNRVTATESSDRPLNVCGGAVTKTYGDG